ncbi:MAG: undecaprenyl/decaprenyl-phosphate alpha-N-acetylglucosaminyl 1-phosphate transferase, partial [Planctomycetales bacterium]|nr:undecaprenyl/decaprenyl-phosphate alpha-N-acetylglucosaminyl 1-phosphate transferase [Planctomycetales bacterium]
MSAGTLTLLVIAAILPSWLISWVAVGWIRQAAQRLGLLDKPGERKVHATPIPLGGGVGIWAGVVGTLAAATLAVWLVENNAELSSR